MMDIPPVQPSFTPVSTLPTPTLSSDAQEHPQVPTTPLVYPLASGEVKKEKTGKKRVLVAVISAVLCAVLLMYFFASPRRQLGSWVFQNKQILLTEKISPKISPLWVGDLVTFEPHEYPRASFLGVVVENQSSEGLYMVFSSNIAYQVAPSSIQGKVWYPSLTKDRIRRFLETYLAGKNTW